MNERIKQLAEDHGFIHDNMTIGEKSDALKKFEKTTELIVRECADIAKHHVMNISAYADAEFVEKQIQTHFGVEE